MTRKKEAWLVGGWSQRGMGLSYNLYTILNTTRLNIKQIGKKNNHHTSLGMNFGKKEK